MMSKTYEDEQHKLKEEVNALAAFIETKEQKAEDITQFVNIVESILKFV